MTEAVAPPTPVSAFAPFRYRAFRWLWLGVVVSSVGFWAQTLGAQWLFVDDPNAATIIPLVQAASALPMVLLALPAGVLSDAFDRRLLMLAIQGYAVVVALLLAVLTASGLMPPALLLAFTFAMGAGIAMQLPTWQPLITELVPRSQFAAAMRLELVSVNLARAAGPALAGWIIVTLGMAWVFVFNAVCVAFLAAVLLSWRRPRASAAGGRERFLPALRAGHRYVTHEPAVRRILVRQAIFAAPATALWALLPLIADRRLGLGAGGYGLLLSALGLGAVAGALSMGPVRRHLSSNGVLGAAALVYAAAIAAVMVVPGLLSSLPLLVLAGFAWTATASTLVAELQLLLPGWVRARALATLLMTFTAAQAFASPVWGLLTELAGLSTAVFVASALVATGALAGLRWRVSESGTSDRAPLAYWADPTLGVEPEPGAGPVQVVVEYQVAPEREAQWLAAMQALRGSRMRSGAFRWELYRVGERPDRFQEVFAVPSWEEHVLQHDHRLTAEDQAIEDAAFALAVATPTAEHLLPPEPVVGDGHGSRRTADAL